MPVGSHRDYFCNYALNVEQYGEILVAGAFGGRKMGDVQPCFDVEVKTADFRTTLSVLGLEPAKLNALLVPEGDTVRIEVKSKATYTDAKVSVITEGTVINCGDNKLNGVSRGGTTYDPMTHLAVVNVNDDGTFKSAWLLSAEVARSLRTTGKSPYIPTAALRDAADAGRLGVVNIAGLLEGVAARAL
jgi:hypothetical protein